MKYVLLIFHSRLQLVELSKVHRRVQQTQRTMITGDLINNEIGI